jgi:hypothetical protein
VSARTHIAGDAAVPISARRCAAGSYAMMSGVSWSSMRVMRSRSSSLRFFRRCT